MSGSGPTPRQRRALAVLAGGGTAVEAAAAAGVTDRTLRRWRTDPDFRRALEDETDRLLDDHRLRAGALVRDSVDRLRDRLRDPVASDAARDRIALAVARDSGLAAFGLGEARPGATRFDVEASIDPPPRILPPVVMVDAVQCPDCGKREETPAEAPAQ